MKNVFEKLLVKTIRFTQSSSSSLFILIYHGVFNERDLMRPNEPTQDEFREQMDLISKYFNPVFLPKAVPLLKSGKLPANSIAVTFDDGYMNNYTIAKPILDEFSVPATFYVSTGFSEGGMMWNDRVIEACRSLNSIDLSIIGKGVSLVTTTDKKREIAEVIIKSIKHLEYSKRESVVCFIEKQNPNPPPSLMMTDKEIRGLQQAGYEVAGHTVTHPILRMLDDDMAEDEIVKGKMTLEAITGSQVVGFAYPNGKKGADFTERDINIVKGFDFTYAVTTHWGVNGINSSPYELMRFTPWDRTRLKFLMRLLFTSRYQ